MKRIGFVLAGVLMAAVAAAALFFFFRGSAVDAVILQQGPLVRTLQFSARVATLSRVDVGSTVTGRVAKVRVNEGARVRAGDVLVELESDELRAALAQALATERQTAARIAGLRSTGRSTARAGLSQAEATVRAAEAELVRAQQLVAQGFVSASRVDEARRAVDVARAQQSGAQALATERQTAARIAGLRSTGRSAARAGLSQAEATVRAAEAELVRAQQLVAQGFVSASRVDEARRAVDVARAQQSGAQAQSEANEDSGTEVAQAQAQLALARAATAAARARLAQAAVLAPADARVLSRQVEPGQIVQPGKALLSLALAGPTQLSAQVDERFLDQLRPGQKAAVVADAFAGQRFAATVLSIAPSVDAQRGAIEVKFSLGADPPGFLREDMTLSVEVETARRDRALVLPLAALRPLASGQATVLVVTDGHAKARSIQLGLRTLDAAEVLQGLAAGDAVVLRGEVQPDARVRARTVAWQPGSAVSAAAGGADVGSALTNAMGR